MFDILTKLFGTNNEELLPVISKGALILDVRTEGEFSGGHADGAINIPLHEVAQRIDEIKKYGKPVVAYCRSGNRSGSAASILKSNGIEAYNAGSLGSINNLLNMAKS